ncbi:TPA: hypothetical protein DCW38_03535, partial [candidate division WOR-3 bacterium]|nr:hypothetical protein [candidate division WOR-3 bacterium]
MKKYAVFVFILFLSLASFEMEFIDIGELQKGMKGYCTTVFNGTKIDTFEVEVIDIIGDGESSVEMALVKCIGANVEKTGIAQGMSGSPVYFNGKLFGSLSYTWDNLREPIGGAVPIKRMLEIEDYQKNDNKSEGFKLKEIAIPIVLTGVNENVLETLKKENEVFKYAVAGKNSGLASSEAGELIPGKGIAINLIDGDMTASAIGTVTYVDNDKVYSFGHPFTLKGKIEYPVSEAYIYMILPRTDISYKMGFPLSKTLGCAVQDRTYGVLAYKNKTASMVNVALKINQDERINLRFIKENDIIASYLPLMLVSAISKYYKMSGAMTSEYKMSIYSKGKKRIEYKNMYTGENLFFGIYMDMQSILYAYLSNMYEKVPVDSIVVESTVAENINQYFVWDVQVEKKYYKIGETVNGRVFLKSFKGEDVSRDFSFDLPEASSQDSLLLYVGGGKNDIISETGRSEAKFQFKDLSTFENIVNTLNPSNSIVIKLYGRRKGFIDNNKE